MTVTSREKYVSFKDIRYCKCAADFIGNQLRLKFPIQGYTAAEYCSSINSILEANTRTKNDRSHLIDKMEQHCEAQILPNNYFEWFKKNDRACCWVWSIIRKGQQLNTYMPEAPQLTSLLYQQIVSNQHPCSTNERYECVIEFFDRWLQSLSAKVAYLERIKIQWGGMNSSTPPFKWLREDDEQCRWALEYAVKAGVPTDIFSPIDTKELYHAVIAAFDLWQVPPDSKKLFLQNINKAWSQKKHRGSLKGKKALNTYLNEDTKKKLDELSVLHRRKIHEMLEDLIIDEYMRIK
jgi:hypothetical protein